MIIAVVPAAGHSTRMGQPKLALPLGDRTVIEHLVSALRQGGVERVLVVTGPHDAIVGCLAASAGAKVLRLHTPTADMRETVECGLDWLCENANPRPDDAWLLAPADCPGIDSAIVRIICAAQSATHSIVVPTYAGRRGHPVLIAWRHVPGIRALPAGDGIDAYLRRSAGETQELPVTDAAVLHDLDTPADYAAHSRCLSRAAHEVSGLFKSN